MKKFVRTISLALLVLACLGWGIAQAEPAGAAMDTLKTGLTVPGQSGVILAQPGDILTINIEILAEGPAFNAFDAYVRFDPQVLSFVPPVYQQDQVGPLMLDACPQSFHLFTQSPDSMTLEIHFSLLCAGASVTGPGVIYQLQFRCRNVDADTHLDLLEEPGRVTRFFMDGYLVQPILKSRLFVQVGEGAAPVPDLGQGRLILQAAPNPFNPRTEFAFTLPEAGPVDFTVYDVRGRLVRRLMRGDWDSGPQTINWDGRDAAGRRMEAGVYLGLLRAANRTASVAVTLIP